MNDQFLVDLKYLFDEIMPFQIEIALKMIPEFSGERRELHKFLSCCDIVYNTATTRAEKDSFLSVVKTKLSGLAYEIVKYGEFDNWEILKPAIQNQFLETRTIAQIQLELLSTRQKQNEDVRSFANKIERLCQDLTDACVRSEGEAAAPIIKNLNKKSALKAFVEGLVPSLKFVIKASRFDDLTAAIEAACEEERTLKCIGHVNSSYPKMNNFIRCYKCGKSNHKANQCYSNKASESNKLPDFQNFARSAHKREVKVNNINITCAYCKNVGHTIDNCRKRQYNNAKRSNYQNISYNTADKSQNSYFNNRNSYSGNGQGPSTSTGSETPVRNLKTA